MVVISDHSVPEMVKIQCDFIPGSDARGCIVILVGELHNTTLNLTRIGDLLTACGSESLPMTASVKDVFGFDIESDGTIGTTQVPGIITSVASSTEFDTLCQPKETNPLPLLSECKHVSNNYIIIITCHNTSFVLTTTYTNC